MFANASLNSFRAVMPKPKRPRLGQRTRHGWNLRPATLGLELRGTALHVACVWPGFARRWLSVTGVIENVPQLTSADLREKLRELMAPAGIEDPTVILGLPRHDVMVRHLTLPIAAEKSLANALSLQLGLYKPSDEEDFCWDAAVLRGDEQLAVTLAFVPRTRVEEVVTKLHDAGFPVSRLTTTQFSTLEWVLRSAESRERLNLLLVQSHGSEIELAVVVDGSCVGCRSFVAGDDSGGGLAVEVEKMLAARRVPAGALQVVYAGADSSARREVLARFGEVRDMAQFCDVYGLVEAAGDSIADQWGAIALALDGLSWIGDYRLNLLPKELRATRSRWQNAPTYVLLALNVLLLTALAAREPLQRQITLRRYNAQIATMEQKASVVERQIKKQDRIEAQLGALQNFQRQGRRPLDALSEVAQKLPRDAWVSVYACRENKVDISGTAKSASLVLPALKAAAQFDDVQFTGGLTRDGQDSERFHIQLKLKDVQ